MTTQTSFTPGPWTYRTSCGGNRLDLDGPNGVHIADIIMSNPDGAQTPWNNANACLIAAAPDLVAALKDLAKSAGALRDSLLPGHSPHGAATILGNVARDLQHAKAALAKASA